MPDKSMDVHLMRRRSRINLKSAWISAPALLHAGQARLILGAEPTMQQAGPLAAWSRSLTRPPALPLSRNLHSRAPAAPQGQVAGARFQSPDAYDATLALTLSRGLHVVAVSCQSWRCSLDRLLVSLQVH